MKRIFIFLFILLLYRNFTFASQAKEILPHILVISSYSPLKEGGNHIISSFLKEINSKKDAAIAVEYMDSESFPEYAHWESWINSLFSAYENPPELVVLIGNEVWSVYHKCCPAAWKNIPIVLGGVKGAYIDYQDWPEHQVKSVNNFPSLSSSFGDYNVTGYYLIDYIKENIELIRKLQPEVTDIAFCYDDRYKHQFLESYLQSIFQEFEGLRLHYWVGSQLSTADLIDSIASYDENLAVLSAGWYTDVNRYSHAYSMLQNEFAQESKHLVYEVMDQDFTTVDFVGGYFVSGVEIGKDLADLVYRILENGFENSPSFSLTPSQPAYHLNYEIFKLFNLSDQLLSKSVVWYNIPPTVWKEYGKELLIALLVTLFLLLGITLILIYRWRREQYYIKYNQKLQNLLGVMPNMAVIYGLDRRIQDIINPYDLILLGRKPEELIGKTIDEIVLLIPEFAEAADLIKKYVDSTFHTGEVHSFNYQMSYQGTKFYEAVRVVPFNQDKVICFVHDETSRIVAENEVVKYKNFLQSVIDHLPLGIFVKNVSDNYRYVFYNQSLKEFYEQTNIDFLGRNDFEVNDALAANYRKEDEEVLKSDKPIRYKRQFRDSKGETHWAIMTKVRLLNNDGFYYIIAILLDITNDRKGEIALEKIRNELSIALDAGSLSAWNYEVEQHLFTSLYHETIAGQGLSYNEAYAMVHPEDREKYRKLMEDLADGKCNKKTEILRFFRNGRYDWFETHAAGVRSAYTNKITQIVGTEKNISEDIRKQLELEENKFKTELVIQSNGIVLWDYDVINRVFSSPDTDSFLHKGIIYEDLLLFIHPDERQLLEDGLNRLICNQATTMNVQMRLKTSPSEYRWMDVHTVVFKRDKEGNVIQLTGLRKDVTDWKNVMEELITLRDKAEESNRLKTAFLANMSHEIRTPLNAIVGFSNLISQTSNPDKIKEYSDIIETNNELLLRLINDILDLSKIEAGQLEFSFSEFRLFELFAYLRQVHQVRVKENVKLICELPAEDCIIFTEKNRLTQVISNFLTNASKFTFEGHIRFGYTYIVSGLRFYVSDTGKGIATENLPHVFDRFMKFDSFVQGTGLGLSICQTIIKRLGGEIGVESELGKGTTFWFTIPCEVKKVNASIVCEKKEVVLRENKVLSVSKDQELLLIAEDNDSNYLLLTSILKNSYRIKRALDGREAVHLYHTLHPALILMDIRMPVMDGLEATAQIRKTDLYIPIVALTANAFDEDRDKALSVGCTDYLTKPVKASVLKALLIRLLERI